LPPSRTVSATSDRSNQTIEEEAGKTPRATVFEEVGAQAVPPQIKVEQSTQNEGMRTVASSSLEEPPVEGRTRPPILAREIDELRIKLRVLEARRGEDQERIKGLELKAIEAENFAQARGKLQGEKAPGLVQARLPVILMHIRLSTC
jgi:hypothetical protein